MLRSAFLMMGLIMLTTVSSASAAVVQFRGVLTSNPISGGTLSLPLNTPFGLQVITGAPGSTSFVTGGFFSFQTPVPQIINVSGGFVTILPGNTMLFALNSPNNVSSVFTFTAVPGLGSTVNQAAFDQLGPPAQPNILTTSFVISQSNTSGGTIAQYSGSVSSVPEPGSVLALCGLVTGAGAWRLRKRKPAVNS